MEHEEQKDSEEINTETNVSSINEPAPSVIVDDGKEVFLEEAPVAPTETKIKSRPTQNLTIDSKITFVDESGRKIRISLPSDTRERVNAALSSIPNIDIGTSNKGEEWINTLTAGSELNSFNDTFNNTLEDKDADFHQTLELNNNRFGSHEVKFVSKENQVFEGESAVLRMVSHLGLGSTWNTALYNTGLWVCFKPPAEEDLVELYRQLTADQIDIARASYGLSYANTTSYVVDRLTKFALNHIYRISANGNEIGPANILDHIRIQDLNSFLWGLACTMFPRGYSFSQACSANPEKCQHIVKELMNLRKLQVPNRKAFTKNQLNHMAINRSQVSTTIKDLASYQNEMVRASTHVIVANEGRSDEVRFTLRSPSISEYVQSGHTWIDNTIQIVEEALGESGSVKEKNAQIDMRARATIMRQYSHFVQQIDMGTNSVTDKSSIDRILSTISGEERVREDFLNGVKNFIENSSVSVIGIPTFDCPVCGGVNEGNESFPHKATMIPIDVIQLFFALLTQKYSDLANR